MDSPESLLPRDGLYRRERFPNDAGFFSWTDGGGVLGLPNPGGVIRLQIGLLGPAQAPVGARLRAGAQSLEFFVRPEPRRYTLLLPPADGERVTLAIDSARVHARRREIGVGVSDIRLAGGGAAPARALLALIVATVGGYALLRQAGHRVWPAAVSVLVLQALVLLWLFAGGWRYGLLGAALLLLGGAGLAGAVLERWLPPTTGGREITGDGRRTRHTASSPIVGRPSSRAAASWSRRDRWLVAALLGAALLVRLPFLLAPDPVGDLELSARRMGLLYDSGLAGAYVGDGDYMPLRLYILLGLSKLAPLLGGGFTAPLPPATLLLIKLPGMLADMATIAVIYCWSRRWRSEPGAACIAGLYALAPPVWINVAWWGQVDALLMLPLLGAVILLDRAGGRWSWLCWAAALLIKTQAILLAPLLFLCTLRQYGCRGLARGAALAGGLLLFSWAPMALAGQGPGLAQSYAGSVERFPRTTVAAYNLWFLALRGGSTRDTEPFILGLAYRQAGLLLVGVAVLLVGIALLRRWDAAARAEAAGAIALAFFCFPTQIHERYLFLALAFLALRIASASYIVIPYMLLLLTATLNIIGTLKGFVPAVYAFMQESWLPLLLAALNLLLCVWLIGHVLLATSAAVKAPAER
jgi:hypothetical protein